MNWTIGQYLVMGLGIATLTLIFCLTVAILVEEFYKPKQKSKPIESEVKDALL